MLLAHVMCLSGVMLASRVTASHGHRHIHPRSDQIAVVTDVVTIPVKMFEYEGKLLAEKEVCQGINNGTFKWAPGTKNAPNCARVMQSPNQTMSDSTSQASSPAVITVTHTVTLGTFSATTIQDTDVVPTPAKATLLRVPAKNSVSTSARSTKNAASSAIPAINMVNQGSTSFSQDNINIEVEFPDGKIGCDEFPVAYGAIHIPWMNLGGWTGVQYAEISDDAVVGLSTGVSGNGCTNGQGGSTTFCSYACPPGYQKSQWPMTQGNASMAVSVGGLKCENGKLWLTNPDLSTNLCIPGTGKSFVNNKLGGGVSICRTDYPGTEDETVPLATESGTTYPLTCPNSETYYQHLGSQTSAEYYVNNRDVPVETACQWDTDGSDEGNWAPVVIGAETDSAGATWLSIMTSRQNEPTVYKELDFSIELVGDFGGSACFYTQHDGIGYYCTSGKLADFQSGQSGCKFFDPSNDVTVPGCTVQLFSGTATYNLVETA